MEAESLVERQVQLVSELQQKGLSADQAISLLALLHGSLQAFREALARMELEAP